MRITVKLSTTLRAAVPHYNPQTGVEIELLPGTSVAVVADQLKLPVSEVKIIMVNGRHAQWEHALHDGDRVSFFPAVGGG